MYIIFITYAFRKGILGYFYFLAVVHIATENDFEHVFAEWDFKSVEYAKMYIVELYVRFTF